MSSEKKTSNPWVFLPIKPLSANDAYAPRAVKRGRFWTGDIYKTKKYKEYEQAVAALLPECLTIPDGELHLKLVVYYNRSTSDIDNCLKPFIDCLQSNLNFNDRYIYRLSVIKKVVKKTEVGIKFWIGSMEEPQ